VSTDCINAQSFARSGDCYAGDLTGG